MPRATLRFGSHNVNGLASKLEGLVQLWRSLHLDIVVVLDTHVDLQVSCTSNWQRQDRCSTAGAALGAWDISKVVKQEREWRSACRLSVVAPHLLFNCVARQNLAIRN